MRKEVVDDSAMRLTIRKTGKSSSRSSGSSKDSRGKRHQSEAKPTIYQEESLEKLLDRRSRERLFTQSESESVARIDELSVYCPAYKKRRAEKKRERWD